MALPAQDAFTGTTGTALTTYSANWTANTGNWRIEQNGVSPNTASNYSVVYWNADSFNDNQYAQAVLKDYHDDKVLGIACRIPAGANTGYVYWTGSWGREIVAHVNGSDTTLAGVGTNLSINDVFRLEVSGTTVTPIRNGSTDTSLGAQTSSAIASGSAGLIGWGQANTALFADTWEGGNLAGGDPTISKSESISVAETVTLLVISYINKTDSATVAESVNVAQVYTLSVSDGVTVAESVNATQVYNASVSDSATVAETVTLNALVTLSVSDAVTVAEALTLLVTSFVNVADSAAVAESVTVQRIDPAADVTVSVSDTIALVEAVTVGVSKNLYLTDALAGTSQYMALQEGGTAPVSATITTGWVVGTVAASAYARMDSQAERASTAHTATVQPDGTVDNTLGDSMRTGLLNGLFVTGNWSFSLEVQGDTRATSTHDGRLRLRMWRSANQDGSAAVEITGATQVTSAYANLANSVAQALTLTYAPGAFTLSNEYLFVQVAHEITGAGNNANSDTHLRVGAANAIQTTGFVPTALISVSDAVAVTDTPTVALGAPGDLTVNKSDAIAVAETVSRLVESYIGVSDSATVAETVNVALAHQVSVSDSVAVSEIVSALLESLANVTDTVSVAEFVTLYFEFAVNVTDSVTVTDAPTALIVSLVSVADTISVAESVATLLVSLVSVSEAIVIAESVDRLLLAFVSVSDASTVAESVNLAVVDAGQIVVNVSDAITVSESVAYLVTSFVNVSESVTIAEQASALLVSLVSVADSIAVAESVAALLVHLPNVADSITVAESVALSMLATVNVADSIAVSESITVALLDSGAVAIVKSDAIALSESVALVLSTAITVSDSVGAAESVSVALVTAFAVSDALTVADTPAALLVSFVGVSDAIVVTDAPTVVMPDPLLISVSQANTVNELVTVMIVGLVSIPIYMASYRRRRA